MERRVRVSGIAFWNREIVDVQRVQFGAHVAEDRNRDRLRRLARRKNERAGRLNVCASGAPTVTWNVAFAFQELPSGIERLSMCSACSLALTSPKIGTAIDFDVSPGEKMSVPDV